jgi:hypothetical protein
MEGRHPSPIGTLARNCASCRISQACTIRQLVLTLAAAKHDTPGLEGGQDPRKGSDVLELRRIARTEGMHFLALAAVLVLAPWTARIVLVREAGIDFRSADRQGMYIDLCVTLAFVLLVWAAARRWRAGAAGLVLAWYAGHGGWAIHQASSLGVPLGSAAWIAGAMALGLCAGALWWVLKADRCGRFTWRPAAASLLVCVGLPFCYERPWAPGWRQTHFLADAAVQVCHRPARLTQPRPAIPFSRVAHACGRLDGHDYLNCLEAFEHNYARGFRSFEIDFLQAADGKVVAAHDLARFDLGPDTTSAEFLSRRLLGRYTPLDVNSIAQLMRDHPDWLLVTDVKDDNAEALAQLRDALVRKGVDYRARVAPQIYSLSDEIEAVRRLGYTRTILTLYRQRAGVGRILAFVRQNPEISAVTMPAEWLEAGSDLAGDLAGLGVALYVHTVNDSAASRRAAAAGAGIYTDVLAPSSARPTTRLAERKVHRE